MSGTDGGLALQAGAGRDDGRILVDSLFSHEVGKWLSCTSLALLRRISNRNLRHYWLEDGQDGYG